MRLFILADGKNADRGNLFNTGHIISGHGTNPNLSMPGAPRNVALTLRYHM
ncbi:hypothetical protein [Herbaspirillum seropedicae]|uniref:hypothetical protein n=1 Tax=Herbaspirillum seropedicae TaxID=964 RepID=UPI0028549292|nr:hypothetical protein [Herbaspirillum seropedicae]MDR6395794.1 hypothetical protein [Herbaspirillum seropedicae]